jgi:hypothetical protein
MIAGVFSAAAVNGAGAQSTAPGAPYADKTAADEWLTRWMQAPGAAVGELHLGRFADRMYFLRQEIGWTPNPGQQGKKVTVPVGFVTDFASIPRVFWSLLPPDGVYTYPAIIHDYLYWERSVDRSEADQVLRFAMEDFKVPTVTITTIYQAVRFGGGSAWTANEALKAAGERRILKQYPTDPTVRWSDWKHIPGVFFDS